MFDAPPRITARVFARLPDSLRKTAPTSEFHRHQPGHIAGHSLLEGPAFDRGGNLWCVDIPWGRIFQVAPTGEFRLICEYPGEPNGLKFHKDGRAFIADFRNGIMVLDPQSGRITPFLERVRLERLKAVNDLTFASNGDLYFTDQGLTGLHDATGRVFRVRAAGEIECLLDNVPSPNGLVLDADESVLYVAVTRANAVWRVPLMRDGTVAKVGTFVQMSGGAGPDGLAMDADQNLYVAHAGLGAVWKFSPVGEPLLRIDAPAGRATTNIAFGGPGNRQLFITEAQTGTILTAEMDTPGSSLFSHAV